MFIEELDEESKVKGHLTPEKLGLEVEGISDTGVYILQGYPLLMYILHMGSW